MVQQQGRFNYWSQLAILLGLVGAGFMIAGFITVAIGLQAMGGNMADAMKHTEALQAALLKPENSGYAQTAQIAGTFFMMFLPSLAFILICHKKLLWAGFSKYFNVPQLIIVFFVMVFANAMAGPFEDISKAVLKYFPLMNNAAKAAEDLYVQSVKSMSNLKDWSQFIIAAVVIAFVPAIFEEMLFRGVVQNLVQRWTGKPLLAIFIASVLFSLVHGSYYLFLSRFVLGAALGLIFYFTKNLWVSIFAHFFNNLTALVFLFYSNLHNKPAEINEQETKMPAWSIIITAALLYGLFVLLVKVSKESRNRIGLKENLVLGNQPLIAQQ